MFIRLSTENDKDKINELIMMCFGDRNNFGVLGNLAGRYLLAFDDNKTSLIAMTGINWCEKYKGFEIDWTCTNPKYQQKGIMHELFKRICALTDGDIYCSCWRHQNKDRINLYSLMRDFGFEEIEHSRVTCSCESSRISFCVAQKSHIENGSVIKESCKCCEDLYLRKAK